MSLSINAKTYTPNSYGPTQVQYNGPGKTSSVKDDALLTQTAPKPSSVFSGVGRTTAKLTRTLTLTGALTPTGDAYVKIDVMVPVGYAGADVDTLLNDAGAFLSSATFKTHVKTPQIAF